MLQLAQEERGDERGRDEASTEFHGGIAARVRGDGEGELWGEGAQAGRACAQAEQSHEPGRGATWGARGLDLSGGADEQLFVAVHGDKGGEFVAVGARERDELGDAVVEDGDACVRGAQVDAEDDLGEGRGGGGRGDGDFEQRAAAIARGVGILWRSRGVAGRGPRFGVGTRGGLCRGSGVGGEGRTCGTGTVGRCRGGVRRLTSFCRARGGGRVCRTDAG
ncbi:hypothetical protein MFU01_14380 [Myxococcus fulvus]|uniref:Uncharacterized protein n=1 Tax=Myxococcus fulvus TaxID=33 RepID=A0A511SWX3_MYXFU|nr:hypothetical protein MFU01_14380 [Myxococcus fulvus]